MEVIRMKETLLKNLEMPRIEVGRPRVVAGLSERYTCETSVNIPRQWQRLGPYFYNVPNVLGADAYGVCYNFDESGRFDYLFGFDVRSKLELTDDLKSVYIGEQRYAVFMQRDHISQIRNTMNTIWNDWMPNCGYKGVNAPEFELYTKDFNPETRMGGLEIWKPLAD